MIKYVCDMCGKPLLEDEEIRYVVRIDVYAAYDSSDAPDEYDGQDAMEEMLDAAADPEGSPAEDDDSYITFRFDLCPECQKQYLQDPLLKQKTRRIRFSDN